MSARDVLRVLWGESVRVTRRDDGTLALVPIERVTPDVLQFARDAKPEIIELLATLPAPGRCPICGDQNGWLDLNGSTTAHCVTCAQIAADRYLEECDISRKAQNGVTY